MRDGWLETTLGDVAEWWSGGTPKAREPKYYENGTIPWAVIADMNKGIIDSTNSYITKEGLELIGGRLAPVGSVLISMYASVGKSAIANIPLATNQAIAWSIPNQKKIIPFYLYLVSQQLEEEISDLARGATQRNINRQMLREFTFQLPPLPEQKRIVDLISSADSYIEALQQQLDSVKRSRNAVLHELLTVGGDDWVETTIGEVVSVVNGGTPSTKSEDYWGGSIVWITTTELTAFDGKRVNSSKRTITVDGLRNGPARLVRAGTTLVGTTATIGTCALADCELTFNQQISGLIPLDKDLDDSYLFYWIQHIKSILEGLSAGTSFKRISTSVLKTVSINFPPIGEQKRIAAVISEMDEFIESIQRTSIEAKNLRSGLLSDLLSGTHEIPVTYDKAMGPA